MGFPVIAAAYGNGALIYAVPFSIMFNILCYTWGIQTLCGGGEKGNWKRIINIGTISGIISIVLFFMQIPVPKMICSLSAGLSNLTGPLSMLVIGISIAAMKYDFRYNWHRYNGQDCSQRHAFCCQFIIPSILLRQHCTHARCRCCHHDQKYFADQPIIYYLTYKKHCSNRDSQ